MAGDGMESELTESEWLAEKGIIDRRKAKVAMPPAVPDILRTIVDEMNVLIPPGTYYGPDSLADFTTEYYGRMQVNANTLKNIAAMLEQIAEQNGGRVLRVERRS